MYRRVERPVVAHLKAGFYGLDGSGKTRTATELAIGLHKHIKSEKGILFIDTETGSDYLGTRIEAAGIPFFQDKTRSFDEVMHDLEVAHEDAEIVIVDSVTHIWREVLSSYQTAHRKKRIDLNDWDPIKREWRRFTDFFLASPLHIILCGRMGNVWEDVYDEDTERHQAIKTGNRMAGEGETGYEPGLCVEMSKKYRRKGGTFDIVATVTKDRFPESLLNGQQIKFDSSKLKKPEDIQREVWKQFWPHMACYTFGVNDEPRLDVTSSSVARFAPTDGQSYGTQQRRRDIAWEEIQGFFVRYCGGQAAREKQLRTEMLSAVFGTTSETRIQGLPPEKLERGRSLIERICERISKNPLPADAKQFLPHLAVLVNELEAEPPQTPDLAVVASANGTNGTGAGATQPGDF